MRISKKKHSGFSIRLRVIYMYPQVLKKDEAKDSSICLNSIPWNVLFPQL